MAHLKLDNNGNLVASSNSNIDNAQLSLDENGNLVPNKSRKIITSTKKTNKSHYNLLDDGYQFGDFSKMFWGEAKQGANNLKNTVVSAPKAVIDTGKNILNESEALKDGYDFGDISKTLGSTVLSTAQNFGEGVIRGAEGIIDFGADVTGGVSDWINTKLEKAVGLHKGKTETEVNKEKAQSRQEMIATNYTDKLMKAVGKDEEYKDLVESNSLIKTDNMGGAIAQELGRQSLNLLINNNVGSNNKIVQSLPMLAGSYGSGIEEAYQNDATTSEARKYGAMNAATETITEWITGGIPGLKGSAGKGLDGLASKIIGEPVEETSKSLAKALLKSGYKLVGEGTEEALSEFINPYLKQFTYNYNSDKDILGNISEATNNVSFNDIATSFIMGAITAGIIDAPNNLSDIKNGYINGKINKANSIQNNTNNSTQNATNLSNLQSSNINNQESINSSQNDLNLANNNLLTNDINTLSKPAYQYTPSDNQKVNNLRESVSKYFDNSANTQNLVNTFEKIIKDKNYNVVFDNTISNEKGNQVNAQIKTLDNGETEIRINPNSNRAGEFLIMHEVTHAIETDSMKELVLDYASKNQEFNQALESLKQTYGTDDVSSEVLSDISGQLFGNQEFINSLSIEKPNIFKRIYNRIIEFANKITGNSKESLFIKDLKNKWEEAYRTQNNNLDETHYMMTGEKGVNNAVKNDENNQWLKDNLDKAKQMTDEHQDKDLIRKKTGWFQDKYGKWKFEVSDKNAHLTNKILNKDTSYKLSDVLTHEDLYELYPKLKDTTISFKDINNVTTKDGKKVVPYGYFNTLTNTITINNNIINNNDKILDTLLHEIQHRIQKIEKFQSGTTISKGSEKYLNNYGEKEARDTSKRKNLDYKEIIDNPPISFLDNKNESSKFAQNSKKMYNAFEVKTNDQKIQKDSEYDILQVHSKRDLRRDNRGKSKELDNSSFSLLKNSDGKEIDISNLKESATMERFHYNRKYDKNNVTAYRGESENTGSNPAFYGLGLYTTLDSKYAKQYGNVSIVDNNLLPDNPLKFKTQNDFNIWEQELAKELGIRKKELYSDDYGVEQYIKKLGYDGLMIGSGKDTDLISFKNSAVKYSQSDQAWQKHLEKNYKVTGTRTNMKDYRLLPVPINSEKGKVDNNLKKQTIKEINQKKIDNNTNAINRLTQEKDAMTKRIEDRIKAKKELLKSKQNQDTKLATQLNIQISNLNNQLQNRKLDYDKRIEYYQSKNNKMNSEEFKIQEQRMTKKQEYIDQAYEMTENMLDWKDKDRGIKYKINTMKRNLHDIMPKLEADRMYNTYFQPITENNAKSENFINNYNERISKLDLNNIESAAVQMLGEYKYNSETLVTGPQVDQYISDNNLNYDKISNAVEEFRNIYDELIVETNKVLKEQGYKEIEYRKGYFPHFQEETRQGKFAKLAEKLGFNTSKNDQTLPTDIAGMTEIFKPGKTYFKNAQQRKGKVTDYNALKGYDNYIRGAADLIFHTEDIQKLRALETVIRTQYTDSSIQKRLEDIYNNEGLDQEQKQKLVDEEYLKINNPLPNFVTELRDYTDTLANKKDIGDRGMEHMLGRETYTIMKDVQSRVSANMVGFNISSALTNFIPITQAWGEVSTKNMFKAVRESISNQFHDDGFSNCSTYLINRTKAADRLYKTKLEDINSKAGVIFESIDSITSNAIVRGKYYDNIDKGMTQEKAIKNANEFAKDIMAGRSKGDMPTIFNRKSPVIKLFTAFQLEVNNQYGYMLKDLPRNLSDEAKNKLVGAFVKMFVGAWLYNKFSEAVVGRKSAFSPIDIVSETIQTTTQEDMSTYDKISSIFTNIVGELPFVGGIMGGGRLPIQAAIPDVNMTVESITQLSDSTKRSKAIKNLTKEISKPLFYVAMPFGGGQLKKTIEGVSMYTHDVAGSYTSSGKLRFTAKKDPLSVAQNLLFGQYSSKEARDYFDNGYAPLTEEQTKEFKELGVSMSTYREYRTELTKLNKIKNDKNSNGKAIAGSATAKKVYQIMNNDEYTEKEKQYLLNNISSSKNKTSIKDLNKIANDEDVYKYYFSLSNDNQNKFINAIEEDDFNSYELYDYYQTKEKYETNYTSDNLKSLMINYLNSSNLTSEQKKYLYFNDYSNDDTKNIIDTFDIEIDNYLNCINYTSSLKESYSGSQYSDYRKKQIFNYIQSLNATVIEKVILYKLSGYSISNYKSTVYNYMNSLDITQSAKSRIWDKLY